VTVPIDGAPPAAAALILELAHGAAFTHIVGTMAQLEIADQLAGGARGVADLAGAVGAEPALLDRLLRAAAVLGLVERAADGAVALTAAGACLRAGPGSLRDLVLMLAAPGQLRPLEHLTEAIADGRSAAQAGLGQTIWEYYREHPGEGAAFAGAMSGVSAMIAGQAAAAVDVTGARRIVDVGGGHGTMLRALLAGAPQARGVVLDQPEVVALAPADGRIEFTAGDFLASVPAGGDVYVLSHVLHDWDDAAAHRILAACHRAAAGGARLLIVEGILADEPGPLMPELMNLHLLVMSGGQERRRDEYRELLAAAGWELSEVTRLPGGQSVLTALRR
jgi:SAM-dependent methyltransferase